MDLLNVKSNIYNKKLIKNKAKICNIKKKSNKSIEYYIHQNFIEKYKDMPYFYYIYLIDNLIFNDKSHLVSKFKDYLVADDDGEFLKRFFPKDESSIRLPKIFKFYFSYSKIFPNYTSLYENKFIYNNIHQKQKMIDIQEKMEKEKKKNKMEIKINFGNDKNNNFDVFSTKIINSLLNATNREGMQILFNVKSDKLTEEENNFKDAVNHIVEEINNCQKNIENKKIKKDIFIHFNSIYSKGDKNKVNNHIMLKNIELNNNKENISQLSNNNIFFPKFKKNKFKNKILNNNINIINELKKHIIKNRNNKLKNYLSNKKSINDNSKNKSKNKIINDKLIIDKMEKELFKMRKKFKNNKKYISQNISTSIQSKKDFSISRKSINQLIINNKAKNRSISELLNIQNMTSSRGHSSKLSSSNSFINELRNQKFFNHNLLSGKYNTKSHKTFKMILKNNKDKYSRNKQLQNSSTTSFIFNNIIKYANKKYIDSRNKKKIKINTKIDLSSLTNRIKKRKNNKIISNNSNSNLIYDYETQNNNRHYLSNKINKNLSHNKSIINLLLEKNNTLFEKSIHIDSIPKSSKYKKKDNSNNIYSAKNLIINSYNKVGIKTIDKKTIECNNFCNSGRNLRINEKNKNKLVINCTHIKLNLTNRAKNNSKDNSCQNKIYTNLSLNGKKRKGIYDMKKVF